MRGSVSPPLSSGSRTWTVPPLCSWQTAAQITDAGWWITHRDETAGPLALMIYIAAGAQDAPLAVREAMNTIHAADIDRL